MGKNKRTNTDDLQAFVLLFLNCLFFSFNEGYMIQCVYPRAHFFVPPDVP